MAVTLLRRERPRGGRFDRRERTRGLPAATDGPSFAEAEPSNRNLVEATMARTYDAIVIGARCAGSPTAMLLARKGYRVLMVDQASFPSDTISTHLIHPPGVDLLRSWGLLDRVVDTGCPPVDTYAFDFGPFVISGTPGPAASPVSYAFSSRSRASSFRPSEQ